jgi:hypothetical protein
MKIKPHIIVPPDPENNRKGNTQQEKLPNPAARTNG